MKFFNIDCHVSVIADLKNIFENIGHEVTSWSLSGHTWIFGQTPSQIDVIGNDSWKSLDQEMCDKFYERYKNELDQYDAFIVTYPTPFALLYERFEKPIIIQLPIRYEYPFTANPEKWKWLNEYLIDGVNKRKIFITSNNKYDQYYANCWIDVDIKYIPSLCEYTNAKYNPKKSSWLLNSRLEIDIDVTNIQNKRDVFCKGYSWENFYEYCGLVDFPYCNSTMSIFEQYTAGFPMLFPSKELLKELYFEYYNLSPNNVLNEISFNKILSLPNQSSLTPKHSKIDPNDYKSEKTIDKFLSLCDYYDLEWMPSIRYFSNFDDLLRLTKEQGILINDNRDYRKDYIYENWNKILGDLK